MANKLAPERKQYIKDNYMNIAITTTTDCGFTNFTCEFHHFIFHDGEAKAFCSRMMDGQLIYYGIPASIIKPRSMKIIIDLHNKRTTVNGYAGTWTEKNNSLILEH